MNNLRYNYTFSIGFDDKDLKTQVLSDEEIIKKIGSLTAKMLGFGTISEINKGVYTYENGETAIEKSVNVTRKSEEMNPNLVQGFITALKRELNQESILVSYTRERTQFA